MCDVDDLEDLGPIPDLVEPITAYKMLGQTPNGDLVSKGVTRWTAGVPVRATHVANFPFPPQLSSNLEIPACTSTPSPPGQAGFHVGEGCGFYTLATRLQVLPFIHAQQAMTSNPRVHPKPVLAELLVWGTVYEYTDGYRSSHAQLVRLVDAKQIVADTLEEMLDSIVAGPPVKQPDWAAQVIDRAKEVYRWLKK